MKNICSGPLLPQFKTQIKINRAMKLTCALLFTASMGVFANGNAQSMRVNINVENVSTKKVLSEIEKQTDYLFVYNKKEVDLDRKTSVNAVNETTADVLSSIFEGTDIVYAIEGENIMLMRKEESASNTALQEEKKITGTVVDASGMPIIGANVMVKGTTNGTITDFDGKFKLDNVNKGDIIQISFIGYTTQDVVCNDKSINVILKEDSKALDEVVVIGYGTQKKADLTGSVANIGADKLTTQSNVNIGQALQGKIAGVDIVSQGGTPGSGSRIMVRGIGTLNNASPLYVVDGMYMSDIDHLNPNDIKSIDVLKDASSAAIYGSRAANGVIIVTTKSGFNTEGKPIIDFSANVGIQTPSKYLDMCNAQEWSQVTTESRKAIGKPALDMAMNMTADNDWQDMMMDPAIMHNYNLTVRGGSKYFNYYTSLGYMNQDGTIKGTDYERFNVQFKTDYRRGWINLGSNIVLNTHNDSPMYPFARGGMLGIILQSIPSLAVYDETNSYGGYGKTFGDVTDIPNPMGIVDKNITKRNSTVYNAYLNLYAEASLPFGLKYKLNFTPDYSFYRSNSFENVFDFGLRNNFVSNASQDRTEKSNLLIEHLLTFDKSFGKHKVSALLGYSYQESKNRYVYVSGRNLPDGVYEVGAATQDRMNDTSLLESAMTSVIARAFYSYNNRYLLTLTYRRDGSSKFAKDNRYGNFPSASLGWNIAEERFMEKTRSWLDQFKIRGGYGVLGNQEIADYSYSSGITANINYPDGNGGLISGAFPKIFANPVIKWEETEMYNVGVDLALLKSRLTLTFDWYRKNTKDILLTVPIPISTGGANDPVRNAGKIKNTGVEWTATWNDSPNSDFSYGITFTGSAMKNKVVAMGTEDQVLNGGTNRSNVPTTKTLAGYPIGGFWLIETDGLFQNESEINAYSKDGNLIQPNAKPGDVKFKDANGDGKITSDDRVYKGSPFAKFTMGLNANFQYKNFDFLLGFQGVFGNKIYNATRQELEGVNKGTNFLKSTLDYWTESNTDASHPRLVWDDPNQNTRVDSDRFLESGSFFRLRNIQVGYTFPTRWFNNKVQKCRVYISGENLFTITDYSGYTPDISNGDATSRGFDNFVYPINRTFMLGLNLTF